MSARFLVRHAAGNLFRDPSRIPAGADVAVVFGVIGDSNAGGSPVLGAALTAALVDPLPGAYRYDKWDRAGGSVRSTFVDEAPNAFVPMVPDSGLTGTAVNASYPVARALQERLATQDQPTPEVYAVHLASAFATIGRDTAQPLTSWSEQHMGGSTLTLRSLFTEYYLRPAIADLLAAGRRVYFAGIYVLAMGSDSADPMGARYVGYPLAERGLAANYDHAVSSLRRQIGARIGIAPVPTYWCEPPRVGLVNIGAAPNTYRVDLGRNRGLVIDRLAALEERDAAFSFVRAGVGDLPLESDGLHYTDASIQRLGRAAVLAGRPLDVIQITALP